MMQIVSHTPLWVFALFAALLVFGLMQTRSRNVNRFLAYALPLGMVALSLVGVQSSFGLELVPVVFWAAGLAIVTLIGYVFFRDTRVSFDPSRNAFYVPGSWLPLLVIMAIFLTKYVVAVMLALEMGVVTRPAFATMFSFAYGCFSGYFAARAANLLAQARTLNHPLPT
jgi:hypothetical protein